MSNPPPVNPQRDPDASDDSQASLDPILPPSLNDQASLDDIELLAACEAIQGPAVDDDGEPLPALSPLPASPTPQADDPTPDAPQPPQARHDHHVNRHDPDPGSRLLVLLWCLWLLGSWASTLLMESAVPGVRWMVYAGLVGMMLMWPVLRLSQGTVATTGHDVDLLPRPTLVLAHVVRDWLSLMLVFQSVLWLLRLTSDWSIDQTLWLDGAIIGWTLITAGILAWGRLGHHGPRRALAMLLCVALIFAEPAAMAVWELLTRQSVDPNRIMRISPISTIEGLTASPVEWRLEPWATQVGCVLLAASLVWMTLALRSRTNAPTQP